MLSQLQKEKNLQTPLVARAKSASASEESAKGEKNDLSRTARQRALNFLWHKINYNLRKSRKKILFY